MLTLTRVLPAVRDIRRLGSCALDLCLVGRGRLDGYFERGPSYWDYAAGGLVAREAGATVVTRPDGLVVAAGPVVHDALLALVIGGQAPTPGADATEATGDVGPCR